MHDGQNPRDLQAKGTRSSSPQVRQQVRTKLKLEVPAARETQKLALHELRQRPGPLIAAPQELREVPTHQQRRAGADLDGALRQPLRDDGGLVHDRSERLTRRRSDRIDPGVALG